MRPLDDRWALQHLDRIDSTQNRCKELARVHSHVLVTAKEQSSGRGRMGRDFFSPIGGLYFSFSYPFGEGKLSLLTPYVVVVLRRLMEEKYNKSCQIKWVNDLYYEGKKVAGILTEAMYREKTHVIIGVGINAMKNNWPEELKEKAGALDTPMDGSFATEFLHAFIENYPSFNDGSFISEYKKYMMGIGKKGVLSDGRYGKILGVGSDGELLLENEDQFSVSTGEVSLFAWE